MLENSRMDSNTVKDINNTRMVTITKDNSLTAFHKVTANISGKIFRAIKEISNKGIETGMECGTISQAQIKITRDITCWIRSMDTEFMTGEMATYTRVHL